MSTATAPPHARHFDVLPSPIGSILVVATDDSVCGIYVADHERAPLPAPGWTRGSALLDDATSQLAEYFAGDRRTFDLPLDAHGTEFQRQVWAALCDVSYGEVASYGDIAVAVGRPTAVRAVGSANGRNPISIVVPCHRVIGSNGTLTGYGWGVERKRWLLNLER
ncbi:MAG: methylated-DNA--[protein]-cysteine S-methyltransferase [Acidimicrobiia bacterium]|nr:methylated-DNA--[protein]-cysteine S-methyltransferase [Acidimicrobiia bacterium]